MSSCGPAAQPGLPFDDAIGQPQLVTKSVQEEHSLNGVYRVGDYYQLSLLVLPGVVTILVPAQWLGGLLVRMPPLLAALFSAWADSCVSGLYLWASLGIWVTVS